MVANALGVFVIIAVAPMDKTETIPRITTTVVKILYFNCRPPEWTNKKYLFSHLMHRYKGETEDKKRKKQLWDDLSKRKKDINNILETANTWNRRKTQNLL